MDKDSYRVACPHKKAGYTATLVACGWVGAVLEKVTRASAHKLKKLKNAKKVRRGPTDIVGCRVA